MQPEKQRTENTDGLPLKGMRICALVSNDTSMDSRVKKECAALAEAGAQVTLVGQTGAKPYAGDITQLRYELILTQKTDPIPEWYARWGRETVFYPLRVAVNLSLKPIRRRDFNAVRPWILQAVRGRAFDVIHANDFDMLATGARLARRSGAKLVYDSHEIYLAPGRLDRDESQMEVLRASERRLIREVSGFITVNPTIADYLTQQYGPPVEPVVIYNGATHCVDQAQPAQYPLRVLFLGTFERYFNFARLIPQMTAFRDKLTLTLQGFDRDGGVQRAIEESESGDFITIRPPVDTTRIVDSIAEFDLGLNNIFPRTLNEVMCSPNKFFDYLSAGLGTVVAQQETFLTSVVEETGCGFVYDQKEPEDLLEALAYLVEHPDEVTAMKRNALAVAPRFSWDAQKKKLVELYQGLRQEAR
ncbi:MAG: glycosyltransferase [Coriobacteriia bacterium]|nr:glycosyltransferase [Coriobacteriia bacterium]